ncbi:hypothetical protein RUND412_001830 [Rhizina undulata]
MAIGRAMAGMSKYSFATFVEGALKAGPPSWGTVLKVVALLLMLVNLKNVPLTWHYRFYRNLYVHLVHRRKELPKPTHLFSPITSTSRSPLYECDLNLHKSNSTYFSDLDIARTHLMCHLIKKSLSARRSRNEPQLYVALAGVTCLFRREIKPFEKYEISTRLLAWDGKWVWVVSHFVSMKKSKDGKRKIFASALSKYVFKCGRQTIKPEVVFMESGLLPQRPGEEEYIRSPPPYDFSPVSSPSAELVDISARSLDMVTENKHMHGDVLHSRIEGEDPMLVDMEKGYWTWERVEAERQRGLAIANHMIGLDRLEGEMRTGEEAGLVKIGKF